MVGKAEQAAAGLKAIMIVTLSIATPGGFSLQIQDKVPNSKKPEPFALVWK